MSMVLVSCPPTTRLCSAVGSRWYCRKPQRALTVLLLEACDRKPGVFQVSSDMWLQRTEGSAQHLPALIQRVIRFALKFSPLKRGGGRKMERSLKRRKSPFIKWKGIVEAFIRMVWLKALRAACLFHSAGGLHRENTENTADGSWDDSNGTSCPRLLSLDDGLESVVSHDRLCLCLSFFKMRKRKIPKFFRI